MWTTGNNPHLRARPLVQVCLLLAILAVATTSAIGQAVRAPGKPDADPQTVARAHQLETQRIKLDKTVWAKEVMAQRFEEVFIRLWDELRQQDDRFAVLTQLGFEQLLVGEAGDTETLDWGVTVTHYGPPTSALTHDQFAKRLEDLAGKGYRIVQTEWHHSKFIAPGSPGGPGAGGEAARSNVSFVIDAQNPTTSNRVSIRGTLDVQWSDKPDAQGRALPRVIAARDVRVLQRKAAPPFQEITGLAASTSQRYPRLMPVLVYDLDGDGLSEVVMGGLNRVFRNKGGGKFELAKFLDNEFDMFDAAIIADFTGDGNADLLCVGRSRQPMIVEGDAHGRFPNAARQCATAPMTFPKSFTAGDVDGDGDLDLFIGQYKFPYVNGAMPTPFYDANDGHPAYLLLNDGKGNFTDVTDAAGLSKKRNRRTYSSSLVDLDDDGDLDLITVNDFCGVDMYRNDTAGGKVHFTDVTDTALDQRNMFGMAHTFGDYNMDGRLDIYAIGMSSTTARRLEDMKLGPQGREDLTRMRPAMGYGNRMLINQGHGVYRQAAFNDRIARTGWSWGTTSFDFDNDGDRDIYIANGHTSGKSARDYCTQYWRHDMYTGNSKADPAMQLLFNDVLGDLNRNEISWNGFEHNVLWMNRGGKSFASIAFLMGVGFEYDSRCVVSDDLDADGRPDLLVTEFINRGAQGNAYRLHAYRNTMQTTNHWVGLRLREEGGGFSPIGAAVTLTYRGGKQVARIVTGDSFSCQHAHTVHFGLGAADHVDTIEVRWPNGTVRRLANPAVDRYYAVRGR